MSRLEEGLKLWLSLRLDDLFLLGRVSLLGSYELVFEFSLCNYLFHIFSIDSLALSYFDVHGTSHLLELPCLSFPLVDLILSCYGLEGFGVARA